MTCEIYFNISRTAIELITLAAVAYATVYVIKDLTDEEKEESESN